MKRLIPILFLICLTQYSIAQVIPQKITVRNSGTKIDSSIYSTKANVNNVADSVLSLVPKQFNPIGGTNVTLSGTYPNITFNSTGGTGTTTYVKAGYGMKVDSSAGNKYTVNADTSVLKNTTNLNAPLFFRAIDTSINADTTTAITGLATKDWVSKHGGSGGGTVTSISRTDGYGIISSVTNPTTTPNITSKVDTTVITSKTFLSNTLSSYFQLPAFTSGYIPFSNGTTLIQSSNLTWDNTNGRLNMGGVPSSPRNLNLIKNYNGGTAISVVNTTGGSSSFAGLLLTSNNGTEGGQLYKNSTTTAVYKNLLASDLGFYNTGAGNIAILNDVTTGNINFAAGGGSSAQFTIGSTGNINILNLKSGSTRPTISGATQNVITDANGQLSFGTTAQTTLVAGTKAISIAGVTTSSKATVSFVSIGGTVSTTWQYAIVCTSGTVTITALTNAGTTDTSDTSTLTYTVTP